MKEILAILIIMFTYAQAEAQTYIGDQKDINQIIKNTRNFSKYVMNSDYQMLGEAYTSDAKIFPQKGKIIEGKKGIIGYWKLPEGIEISHHKITQIEIKIIGDTAYDYGYYEGITQKTNGEEDSWEGKYVIVWKKENNVWKIYLDIWNNI